VGSLELTWSASICWIAARAAAADRHLDAGRGAARIALGCDEAFFGIDRAYRRSTPRRARYVATCD
jgi:hypothetical protein